MFDIFPNGGMPEHPDQFGVWEHCPDQGAIRRRKYAGKDTIGDLRLTYFVPEIF